MKSDIKSKVVLLLLVVLSGCQEKEQPIQQVQPEQQQVYQQPQQAYQPPSQPVIINQQPTESSSGLMTGALGFMAGRMLANGGSSGTTNTTHIVERHYIQPSRPISRGRSLVSRPISRMKR